MDIAANFSDKRQVAELMKPLWQPLRDEERQQFVDALELFTFERNETVYRAGQEPQYIFYLLNGYVSIHFSEQQFASQVVRMVEPGALFGCQPAFSGSYYKYTAVARCRLCVAAVPLELVYHLIWENGSFAILFVQNLSELLGISVQRTVSLTQKRIRARLADTLLAMANRYGLETDHQTIGVELSRNDLAQMSNMTTSNAIRTLSTFAQEGLVDIRGRKIGLLNESELRRISIEG